MAEKEYDKCPIEGFEMALEKCSSCRHYMQDHCQYPKKKRK